MYLIDDVKVNVINVVFIRPCYGLKLAIEFKNKYITLCLGIALVK